MSKPLVYSKKPGADCSQLKRLADTIAFSVVQGTGLAAKIRARRIRPTVSRSGMQIADPSYIS